jgi:heptosyltransferase-2
MNLLVFVPNWLGDVAMATPALRALRRGLPDATLTVAGRASACALLRGLPHIDHYIELRGGHGLRCFARDVAALRRSRPDAAVVFPHSFRAALLARLSGASRRVGYDRDGRRFLLTQAEQPYREEGAIVPIYMGAEYLGLARALGCQDDEEGLELSAAPETVAQVRTCLGSGGPVVGFAPGAAFGPSKCWPADRYAAVADRLTTLHGARCVLLTGPGEEATREAVQQAAQTRFITCDGGRPTIELLKATISQLDLLICNDSGPRHIAVAFGVSAVCLMGSTSPRYSNGPYEKGEVLRVDVDCGPCQKPVCTTDFRCMTRIGVEWVVETAQRILGQSG